MIAEIAMFVSFIFLVAGICKYIKFQMRLGFVRFVWFSCLSTCFAFTPRVITWCYSYGLLPPHWADPGNPADRLSQLNIVNSIFHVTAMAFFYLGARGFHKALDRVMELFFKASPPNL